MTERKFDELRLVMVMATLLKDYIELREHGMTPDEWYMTLSLVRRVMQKTHQSLNFAQLDRRAEDEFQDLQRLIPKEWK